MSPGNHVRPLAEPDPGEPVADAAQIARLERRLWRERCARREAETISELVTRELYDKQQGLMLMEHVAKASNEATEVDQAIMVALEQVCCHGSWALAHAWLLAGEVLQSSELWWGDDERFVPFHEASRGMILNRGEGLPGRVMATAESVWIDDFGQDVSLPRSRGARSAGLVSALGVPVLAGDSVVAVLEFLTESRLEPERELIALVAQIGTQLGRVFERQNAARALVYQATHDALTGLPGRALILDQLNRALSRQRRSPGTRAAVFFLDLDGFKSVNDSLGHAAGDLVLRDVAQRLGGVLRPHDTLGRLGGDEFVIVCEGVADEHAIVTIAERLRAALLAPFKLAGEQFLVSASIGIALADADDEAQRLIGQADAAMYRAKQLGRARYEIFSDELRQRIDRRLVIEGALRHAVARSELVLHYQPEIDLRTGQIVGVEALLRWQRPDGMVMPDEFIPLAEQTGLIVSIGAWVLDEAVRQSRTWQSDPAIDAPWTAVNLSVRQLMDPDLKTTIADVLGAHGSDPAKLFLEVTESLLLDDADTGLRMLSELCSLGAQIAIDDFGKGYASLSYLRRFPASLLKIDRSFIATINEDPRTRVIVTAIIEMTHALGLQVVAEGIETEEQLNTLRELGCDLGQGYYFARPQPAAELGDLLRRDTAFAALACEPGRGG